MGYARLRNDLFGQSVTMRNDWEVHGLVEIPCGFASLTRAAEVKPQLAKALRKGVFGGHCRLLAIESLVEAVQGHRRRSEASLNALVTRGRCSPSATESSLAQLGPKDVQMGAFGADKHRPSTPHPKLRNLALTRVTHIPPITSLLSTLYTPRRHSPLLISSQSPP